MRFMVWNMRWMTRYFGFMAHPIVRFYASQEIIACGLNDKHGNAIVIYTPSKNTKNYNLYILRNKWIPMQTLPSPNFSSPVVLSSALPNAIVGELYKMRAETSRGRTLSSPTITNKGNTIYMHDLLSVVYRNDFVCLSWEKAEKFDPMIYFLVIEDSGGNNLSAIYTRENFWTYPLVKKASLSVGLVVPPKLKTGQKYKVKILVVDFDGWVSHLGEKTFVYERN